MILPKFGQICPATHSHSYSHSHSDIEKGGVATINSDTTEREGGEEEIPAKKSWAVPANREATPKSFNLVRIGYGRGPTITSGLCLSQYGPKRALLLRVAQPKDSA